MAVSNLDGVLEILRTWVDATVALSAEPRPPFWRFGKRLVHSHRIGYAVQRRALYDVIVAVRTDLETISDITVMDEIADRLAWYLVAGLLVVIRADQGAPVTSLTAALEAATRELTQEMRDAFSEYERALDAIRDESARRSELGVGNAPAARRDALREASVVAIAIMDDDAKRDKQVTRDLLRIGERGLAGSIPKHRARLAFNYRALKWLLKGGSIATAAAVSGVPALVAHKEALLAWRLAEEALTTLYVDPTVETGKAHVMAEFERFVAIDGGMNLIQVGVAVLGSLLVKRSRQQQAFAALTGA